MNRRKSKPKEKLNIAMFGQKRIPSREGGVEIVVEELCTRMVAQGHNVTCYNRGGHHVSGSEYDSKRLKEYKGIKLKTVPTIEKKGLTGFVQGQELEELYSNAYVYVLPSDLEGMPLSLLEAMSYGNCCLVSDIPECVDVVEDKALIFQKSDVNSLYTKLRVFLVESILCMRTKYAENIVTVRCVKMNWINVVHVIKTAL